MATPDKASVRSLSKAETDLVCDALELKAKSCDRASRASTNSVVASEHSREASVCRNLVTHFRNGFLDV